MPAPKRMGVSGGLSLLEAALLDLLLRVQRLEEAEIKRRVIHRRKRGRIAHRASILADSQRMVE